MAHAVIADRWPATAYIAASHMCLFTQRIPSATALMSAASHACRRVARASSWNGSEGDVLVPMEAMGETYSRLANNGRVGSAIKAGSA